MDSLSTSVDDTVKKNNDKRVESAFSKDITIVWVDQEKMKPKYERNNRSDKHKNLQCFPYCMNRHASYRFCGTTLIAEIMLPAMSYEDHNVYLAIGEFKELQEKPKEALSVEYIDEEQLFPNMRTRDNLTGKYYEGLFRKRKAEGDKVVLRAEFNSELLAWHYGYVSNKQRQHLLHTFEMMLLGKVENKRYRILSRSCTTGFQICSSRRNPDTAAAIAVANLVSLSSPNGTSADVLLKNRKDVFQRIIASNELGETVPSAEKAKPRKNQTKKRRTSKPSDNPLNLLLSAVNQLEDNGFSDAESAQAISDNHEQYSKKAKKKGNSEVKNISIPQLS